MRTRLSYVQDALNYRLTYDATQPRDWRLHWPQNNSWMILNDQKSKKDTHMTMKS